VQDQMKIVLLSPSLIIFLLRIYANNCVFAYTQKCYDRLHYTVSGLDGAQDQTQRQNTIRVAHITKSTAIN